MRRPTRRQRIAAAVLAAVAAGFLALDLTGSGLASAHSGVRGALGALYRGTDSVLGPVRRFAQGLPHAGSNEQRVRTLRQQNAVLRKELADARIDASTATQLRRLKLSVAAQTHRIVPARVIATDPAEGFDYTVTLDVGSTSGIRAGQTVTDGAGLVGRVVHADRSSTVVLLAVDPQAGVGARDARSGELGVATGTGLGGFTFRPLDPGATVRVGDPIATGPAGSSSFVSGLSIGTVRSVRTAGDGTTTAAVTATVSMSGLDLVGVIVDRATGAGSRGQLANGRR